MSSKINIEISQELYRRIQARIAEFGFDSVDECAEFVMNEFISDSGEKKTQQDIPEDEEMKIKKRLHSLGYLE
jgi:hypothetical protein